jgi:hypothetical protein
MMPFAQLDPASLTIWYDPEHVHGGSNREALAEAVNHALNGDDDAAVTTVRAIDDETDKVHGINLVSSIWHERRHFLDLLLTNYGSFRLRQFIQLYANCTVWGEFARSGKPIACPIDLYLDPVRCEVLGVETPSKEVLKLAKEIADRKIMHADDTKAIQTANGLLNVGGEAQLEALAYFAQFIAVQERFGLDLSLLVQRQRRMFDPGQRKYNWANLMFVQAGLAVYRDLGDKFSVIDYSCLFPLLFASLATRRFGQEQVTDKKGGSGYAAMRLAALLHHIKDNDIDLKRLTVAQSWQRTNEIAQHLWGRSILEEMEEDYRREGVFFKQLYESKLFPTIERWLKDIHRLRGILLELLKTDPTSILDPIRFSAELLPKLQPIVINTQKSGVLGKPSPPFERVFGYKDPEDTGPESEWWWAITTRKRQTSSPNKWWQAITMRKSQRTSAVYKLEDFDASMDVVSTHAPFAKMLLNGRRHRTMLGPEILYIQMTLLNQGLNIQFDPLFAFPDEDTDPSPVFTRRPNGEAKCDLCQKTVTKDTSILVSPWVFRYNKKNAEFCVKIYGGGKQGQLRYWRDWSPWLVCRECAHSVGLNPNPAN